MVDTLRREFCDKAQKNVFQPVFTDLSFQPVQPAPEDADEVRDLISYSSGVAGSLMGTEQYAYPENTLRSGLTSTPPVIDGLLNDQVWTQAPSETGFKTWRPDFGKDMQEKTVVYYAYDCENLYFAYRCFDQEPSRIKTSITARDTISQDIIKRK